MAGDTMAGDTAAEVVSALAARGMTLATAESCTGGLLAGRVTDVPGASAVFMGGIVSYDNRVKRELLGVPAETLETRGAVSAETATAMAEGALARVGTSIGVSTTGIAGPGGAVPGKPVGTVFMAVAGPAGTIAARRNFDGDRAAVRAQACKAALEMVADYLENNL